MPEYKKDPGDGNADSGGKWTGMCGDDRDSGWSKLPIIGEWSDAKLKKAPCRYSGSAYLKNMIIAGHNYRTIFRHQAPESGDRGVYGCGMENVFSYEVTEIETVGGYDIEKMEDGGLGSDAVYLHE